MFTHSIDGCLAGAIGEHGLSDKELAPYLDKAAVELDTLKREYDDQSLPILRIAEDRDDLDAANLAITRLSQDAELIVFFGTGGSSLGGQALAQMSGWNIPGFRNMRAQGRPRTRFYDNLDGETLEAALNAMEFSKTRFVVTSKSGGTAETMAQAIVALAKVKEAGLADRIPDLFLGITEPASTGKPNGLRTLFSGLGIPMLDHHTGIGGRFSCLTNVGLIVALSRGLDAHAVRIGARDVIDGLVSNGNAHTFAPALGAAVSVALNEQRDIGTAVMMPYSDRLARFANWFAQLWAESLGKDGKGTSPIAALGPVDQHSQLQLFMDGPRDHVITIIRLASDGGGSLIDADMAKSAGLSYLAGRTVGDIVDAQSHALPEALLQAGRPVRLIDIEQLNERTMGQLLMHFMLETVIAGRMMGINPFDQPGVELAKVLTKERLLTS